MLWGRNVSYNVVEMMPRLVDVSTKQLNMFIDMIYAKYKWSLKAPLM